MRILILISFVVNLSCSKSKLCFSPAPPTPIRLVNTSGQDLLNPQNSNSYSISNIRMYYQENGATTYEQLSLDSIPGANTFFLLNGLSWNSHNGRNFYIQLTSTDVDTIYLRCDRVSRDGCAYFNLVEFKYNNRVIAMKSFVGGPLAYEVIK